MAASRATAGRAQSTRIAAPWRWIVPAPHDAHKIASRLVFNASQRSKQTWPRIVPKGESWWIVPPLQRERLFALTGVDDNHHDSAVGIAKGDVGQAGPVFATLHPHRTAFDELHELAVKEVVEMLDREFPCRRVERDHRAARLERPVVGLASVVEQRHPGVVAGDMVAQKPIISTPPLTPNTEPSVK